MNSPELLASAASLCESEHKIRKFTRLIPITSAGDRGYRFSCGPVAESAQLMELFAGRKPNETHWHAVRPR